MNNNEKTDLVCDALYGVNVVEDETCFTHNEAGLKLIACGPDMLPVIEETLRDIVNPEALVSRDNLQAMFPGLDYVLGAYLVIGQKAGFHRIASFLKQMSSPLLAEAIAVIPVFWSPDEDRPMETSSTELKRFLVEHGESANPVIRDSARRVLKKLG